jgi:hypothetical protein
MNAPKAYTINLDFFKAVEAYTKQSYLNEQDRKAMQKAEDELWNAVDKIRMTMQRIENNVHTSACEYKPMCKTKLNKPTEDVCPVCFEQHPLREVVQTSCGHQIGMDCYQLWINQCLQNKIHFTCPVCRTLKPKNHGFYEKGTRLWHHASIPRLHNSYNIIKYNIPVRTPRNPVIPPAPVNP